jgi:bifunctional non-homologous end joining protein LigD
VDAALKKGDLKFTLNGYKLKGSWVLVRTRGWGSKKDAGPSFSSGDRGDQSRSWLLIKHTDEWSGEVDITTFAPNSVKSDGDFEDILGDEAPAVWKSNRPAKSGDAGAMFARILGQAEKLKVETNEKKTPGKKTSTKRPPSKAKTAPSRSRS